MSQEKKLRIAIFVSYAYPYVGSGLGQVAITQAEGLAKLGHEVVLISSNIPATKKRFKKNGVLHIKLDSTNFLDKFQIPVPLFLLNGEVLSRIKYADVVHAHDMLYPSSLQAALAAKIFRKPFVLTQHAGFISYPSQVINFLQLLTNRTLGRFVLDLSDEIIVVNEEVKNWLRTNGKSVVTLMNGVNTHFFYPASEKRKRQIRKKYGLPVNKKIVLYVGRLVEKKGFHRLYDARSNDYLTVMVGGGKVPESMAVDVGKVLFLGTLPQKKLSEIYQASDVFILPSDCEGFPLSIQEAMASGLPIITSNHPGFDRYLDRRFVKFINPTSDEIRDAILQVLNDKKTRDAMIDYSLRTTEAKESWEKNVTGLLEIYHRTIK